MVEQTLTTAHRIWLVRLESLAFQVRYEHMRLDFRNMYLKEGYTHIVIHNFFHVWKQ